MHREHHFDDPDVRDDQVEYIGEGADPELKQKAEHYLLGEEDEEERVEHNPDVVDEYYYGEDEEDEPAEPPL